jgi:hypothetical protein
MMVMCPVMFLTPIVLLILLHRRMGRLERLLQKQAAGVSS